MLGCHVVGTACKVACTCRDELFVMPCRSSAKIFQPSAAVDEEFLRIYIDSWVFLVVSNPHELKHLLGYASTLFFVDFLSFGKLIGEIFEAKLPNP